MVVSIGYAFRAVRMNIDVQKMLNESIRLEGNCSGVYFLYDGDELVYIGKGWNCFLRVAEHTRKDSDKKFTSWSYVRIENESEYVALEKQLIKRFSPKYNKTHKSV
ncbi:MAG: hypothetical protein RBS14_03965 [Atribacterota bacterium]|nr:hypothetical protein [Atribacterota bacterium]